GSYDPDHDAITFSWVQTGGPTVSLTDANTAKAKFSAPTIPGGSNGNTLTLTFDLTVTDVIPQNSSGSAMSNTKSVRVTVEQVNHAPTANAGTPQTVYVGQTVTLDGSLSNDIDGDTLTNYTWTQSAGTSTSSLLTGKKPTFTAPSTPGPV